MARSLRHPTDRVISNADHTSLAHLSSLATFWRALEETPYAFDLFFALRVIEARTPEKPRLGLASHVYDEPLRIGQTPQLTFAPATIASAYAPGSDGAIGKIQQYAFGLFGPNGPLPNHLSELAYERSMQAHDTTLCAFADLFHHRATLLFYRGWANAQSVNALDRKGSDSFTTYVGTLSGYGSAHVNERDQVKSFSLRHVSGHFVRHARNSEGIENTLAINLGAPVEVSAWRFNWLQLPASEQTRLGRANASLGKETVAGSQVPDRQHRFRIRIGPLSLVQYERLLPVGSQFKLTIDWVRNYVGYEYAWDMQLVLKKDEVPFTTLGGTSRLGWTSWLHNSPARDDADDFAVSPEAIIRGRGHIEASRTR